MALYQNFGLPESYLNMLLASLPVAGQSPDGQPLFNYHELYERIMSAGPAVVRRPKSPPASKYVFVSVKTFKLEFSSLTHILGGTLFLFSAQTHW
jgi:hypothetical protein